MDPEEKEKMEKRDWLAEKIQMLNTQLEGFEADVEKAVSCYCCCCCCRRCRMYAGVSFHPNSSRRHATVRHCLWV